MICSKSNSKASTEQTVVKSLAEFCQCGDLATMVVVDNPHGLPVGAIRHLCSDCGELQEYSGQVRRIG